MHPFLWNFLLVLTITYAHPGLNAQLGKKSLYGDPRRNITCLGGGYDLKIPFAHGPGVDPDTFTMQQLCAKTIYGGAPAGQHFGGWCSQGLSIEDPGSDDGDWPDPDPDEIDESRLDPDREWSYLDPENPKIYSGVSFDLSLASQAVDGPDPRFLLGCFNRCFCNYGVTDLTKQPKRTVPSNADVRLRSSDQSGEIWLDVVDGWDVMTLGHDKSGRLGDVEVETVEMNEIVEPNRVGGSTAYLIEDQTLDTGNYITCEGDLPQFLLPQPYPVSEFRSPQELCAV